MSFLLVCGKIFVCDNCQMIVRVEYEGGAQITQIGDMNIMQQLDFSQNLGQPNNEPDEQGYYLYDFGLCDKCFETEVNKDDKIKSEEIVAILDELSVKREETLNIIKGCLPDLLSHLASGLSVEDIGSAIGQRFDPTFGDKHATAAKRERLLNNFLNKHGTALIEDCVRKALTDPSVSTTLRHYRETTQTMLIELKRLVSVPPPMHIMKNTELPENLNDWIVSETTIRRPVTNSPRETFYFEVEMDFDDVLSSFYLEPESLYEEMPSMDYMRLFRSRLVELIKV